MRFGVEQIDPYIRLLLAYRTNWNSRCREYEKPYIGLNYVKQIDLRKEKILSKIVTYIDDKDYEGFIYCGFHYYREHLPYINQFLGKAFLNFYQSKKNVIFRDFVAQKLFDFNFVKKNADKAKDDFYYAEQIRQYITNPIVFAFLYRRCLLGKFVDEGMFKPMLRAAVSSYLLWPSAYSWIEKADKEIEKYLSTLEKLYHGAHKVNDKSYKVYTRGSFERREDTERDSGGNSG